VEFITVLLSRFDTLTTLVQLIKMCLKWNLHAETTCVHYFLVRTV